MLNTPLAPWPSFTAEESEAAARVVASNRVNYWTGQECREFETEFAAWTGAAHAVAVSNGTLALDLALKALDIGAGNEVIVTPRTFIASISCVVNAGAVPVFADVDAKSGNISPETILPKLTERTKAIIPVHLAGWPCDMPGIMALSEAHGLKVIEDCAQAHGATINGRHVGTFGHIGAWSFCQDKIMTTGGEGGMVTTDDKELWSRMWSFKDHGKNWNAVYNREHAPGFRWLHDDFGTNWRMLEVQGAIGRIQLRRMREWTRRRREIAAQLTDAMADHGAIVSVPAPPPGFEHANYRLYAYVDSTRLRAPWSRDHIAAECTRRGAPVFQGSCSEVYLEKAFDNSPWRPAQRLPNALRLGEESLMFLTHPTITDAQLDGYCRIVAEVLSEAAA